jgi:hypothetical protein
MTDTEKIYLLATRIMGWSDDGDDHYDEAGTQYAWAAGISRWLVRGRVWNPLSRIADAWQVFERLQRDCWCAGVEWIGPGHGYCAYVNDFQHESRQVSACVAICEVALKHIGAEELK